MKKKTRTPAKRRGRRRPRLSLLIPAVILLAAGLVWMGMKVTENGEFTVVDYTQDPSELVTYRHYLFAANRLASLDPETPACIVNQDGKVVAIRSGIVDFTGKDVTQNTEYRMEDGRTGYLNGSYGADGLYLGTNDNGTEVHFQMAGVTGWVNVQDISLRFYNETLSLSGYNRYGDSLVHQISGGFDGQESLAYSISECPDFIQNDTFYYSYDGHRFYTDFYAMSEAVRSGQPASVNEDPWYDPYQFTPHRTLSALTNEEGNAYLNQVKGITEGTDTWPMQENQSVLWDAADLFTQAQDAYWMNARMMFSLALNESAYGQSEYAVTKHNLFGHGAGDEDPDAADGYDSLQACVDAHAWDWLQKRYADPESEVWNGSWFGDKASGINVMYASDPYWGEKAGSFLFHLGWEAPERIIRDGEEPTPVYDEPDGKVLYTFPGPAVLVTAGEEKDGWIPVRSEAPVENGKLNVDIPYEEDDIVWIRKQS